MTANFDYIAGLLDTMVDTLSCPLVEEDADEVYTIMTAKSPRQWDEKELLVAQKEDH